MVRVFECFRRESFEDPEELLLLRDLCLRERFLCDLLREPDRLRSLELDLFRAFRLPLESRERCKP